MSIRHQPKSEKYPYASPTTPGLYVAFRAYIIELICLNVNPKLNPRFWSDPQYWGPKFRREVKGVKNISQQLDITDTLVQTALVQVIKQYNIKALVAKKTVTKVIKLTYCRMAQLGEQRVLLAKKSPQTPIDMVKNATFVDIGEETTLAKVRKAENG